VLLAVLGVALVACGIYVWRTNDVMASLPFLHQQSAETQGQTLVDQTPWQTAETLTTLAVTQEELGYARQAQHLADHEVDQAFASALREANMRRPTLNAEAVAAQQKVATLEGLVAADTASMKAATPKGGDDLDVAKAQLGLDQDELNDARDDYARASGDLRGDLQQELTAREAQMKKYDAGGTGEVAVISAQRYRTLAGLLNAWKKQKSRYALVLEAKAAAERDKRVLMDHHGALEAQAKVPPAAATRAADRVAALKMSSLERQLVSISADRIEAQKQLSEVYGKWAEQITLQHRILLHLIVVQWMIVAIILMVAIFLSALASRFAEQDAPEQRRKRTLGRIARIVAQVLALIAILLVMFGPPSQISTFVGLATAGLTVALQDFILAFVGWFVLMGRTGIGIGDVVEINGVAGEVVDIGLFRTTLLETGNWTAKGHPTGRRVAFNNKFAISGQFFNFSTAGQWMWDELTVTVPLGEETSATVERVQKVVQDETQADAQQAEREWRRASRQRGLSQFSAEPAVNMRPSSAGVDLVVRYVTRASGRFERRNKLYRNVLTALHLPAAPVPPPEAPAK
jgi:small-conductance mechanosensitive channel